LSPVEQLIGLVNGLSPIPDDYQILATTQAAAKVAMDAGSPATCIDVLLTCCENDWRLSSAAASCAASFCHADAINSTNGGSFRTLWLKTLQSLFLRKWVVILTAVID